MNNVWVEKFEKFLTNDGRHRYIDKSTAKLIIEYVEKEILQSEQPIIEDVVEDVEKAAEDWVNTPHYDDNGHKGSFKAGVKWKKNQSNSIDAIGFAEWIELEGFRIKGMD